MVDESDQQLFWCEIPSAIRHFADDENPIHPDDIYYGTIKLDGTNLAIDADGQIYGRKHPVTGDKHCGTCLKHLRDDSTRQQIRRLRSAVAQEFGGPSHSLDRAQDFVVYGEFGIQRESRYRRTADNLGQWTCFGIRIRFPVGHSFGASLREAEMISDLRSRGHRFQRQIDERQRVIYTLLMSSRLRELFTAVELRSSEIKFIGRLDEWIAEAASWLETKEEEGLVIVTPEGLLLKWKCALELQPRLTATQISATQRGGAKRTLILRSLMRVVEESQSRGSRTSPKNSSKERNRQLMRSALSKFNVSDWELEFERLRNSSDDTRSFETSIKRLHRSLRDQLKAETLVEHKQLTDGGPVDAKMSKQLDKLSETWVARIYASWQNKRNRSLQ